MRSRCFQNVKRRERNWKEVRKKNLREGNETGRECEKQKTFAKEAKLGGSAKNKEQREGVRRAKETLAINPRHFAERPQTCCAPLRRQLSHENQ